jgi:flagellar hook-basal body complex protein FliE
VIPPISPLSTIGSGTGAAATSPVGGGGGLSSSPGSSGGSSGGFSNSVTNAIDQLQQVQNSASSSAALAAAGQGNLADAMIAATQASVDTQVTTAVANKAIAAFTQVMNMQV